MGYVGIRPAGTATFVEVLDSLGNADADVLFAVLILSTFSWADGIGVMEAVPSNTWM